MGRRLAAVTAAVSVAVVALGLAGCSGAAPEPTGPQGIVATITTPPASPTAAPRPAPTSSSQTAAATGWYLALGDSLAAGYQPPGGDRLLFGEQAAEGMRVEAGQGGESGGLREERATAQAGHGAPDLRGCARSPSARS